jgi:hypothetical protein
MADVIYPFHVNEIYKLISSGHSGDDEDSLRYAARLILSLIDGILLQCVASGDSDQFRRDSARAGTIARCHIRGARLHRRAIRGGGDLTLDVAEVLRCQAQPLEGSSVPRLQSGYGRPGSFADTLPRPFSDADNGPSVNLLRLRPWHGSCTGGGVRHSSLAWRRY